MNLDDDLESARTATSAQPSAASASAEPIPGSSAESTRLPPAEPEVGDVIDALEDALASLKSIVKNHASTSTDGVRAVVRENPIAALAVTAGVIYLLARWRR